MRVQQEGFENPKDYECDDKLVSHPSHYQSASGIESIDVIEAFTEDLEGVEAIYTGNILKYAMRWKKKGGVQDLKKIMWYTQRLINFVESKEDTLEEHIAIVNEKLGTNITLDEVKKEEQHKEEK